MLGRDGRSVAGEKVDARHLRDLDGERVAAGIEVGEDELEDVGGLHRVLGGGVAAHKGNMRHATSRVHRKVHRRCTLSRSGVLRVNRRVRGRG
jgi:hypothetical protein